MTWFEQQKYPFSIGDYVHFNTAFDGIGRLMINGIIAYMVFDGSLHGYIQIVNKQGQLQRISYYDVITLDHHIKLKGSQ